MAGIDVVSDGELNRWDVNHAETNGMIDYFVRPMSGIESELTWEQLAAWRAAGGMSFRAKPPGIVTGPVGSGTLNLRADYDLYRDLTTRPKKFTVTSPYMLAKTLADQHYGDVEQLVMAIADVLRQQVAEVDAEIIQVDEANVTGHPEDAAIAAAGINRVLEGVQGEKAVPAMAGPNSATSEDTRLEKLVSDVESDRLCVVSVAPVEMAAVWLEERPSCESAAPAVPAVPALSGVCASRILIGE